MSFFTELWNVAIKPWQLATHVRDLEARLGVEEQVQTELAEKHLHLEELMARTAEELAAAFDAATNEVASDIQAVRTELEALKGNVDATSQAAVDAALAKLDAPLARLQELGADPADPIPPAPEPAPQSEPAPEPGPAPE